MKELFYAKDQLAILNYTKSYPQTFDEVLDSDGFASVLMTYLDTLQAQDVNLYHWLTGSTAKEEAIKELTHLLKMIIVFPLEDIVSPYLQDRERMLHLLEELYDHWRQISRFALVTTSTNTGLQLANFMEADNRFNQLILNLYRTVTEKLQGRKNTVYRQLNAGTNACIVTRNLSSAMPSGYEKLKHIPFIDSLMLRTPLILHPSANKRVGSFVESESNPITEFRGDAQTWFCYPAKIGSLTAFLYFHRDYIANGISLANLFELASEEDIKGKKPDLILLYGNEDRKDECRFFYDENNDIYVGSVSYSPRISYFGYMKKMSLTLHNLSVMKQGKLPVHGSMVNITLRNGTSKGVILVGDSGAGKSETIEALRQIGSNDIAKLEVIFDDMGSIGYEDGILYAQGTETGAFLRLDDLEKTTAYRDMDRSIFMNPQSSNARVIVPVSSYDAIVRKHPIDMMLYANNFDDVFGVIPFHSLEDAKETFRQGRRFAVGTTHEFGLTQTYFANPFGPMQKQEECDVILDRMFDQMEQQGIFLGEIYTRLAIERDDHNGIKEAARVLLEYLKQQ